MYQTSRTLVIIILCTIPIILYFTILYYTITRTARPSATRQGMPEHLPPQPMGPPGMHVAPPGTRP